MLTIIKGGLKVVGQLTWLGPLLLWRRRRAVAVFRRGLCAQGLERETAEELSSFYKQMVSMRPWIPDLNQQGAGGHGKNIKPWAIFAGVKEAEDV
ncbi:MAG: hypothetical protein GX251_00740 [Firmicutes bacterium]|mgnify:CR=1 FL=1|nr:hypothetical protein [Bacillota bacterium]